MKFNEDGADSDDLNDQIDQIDLDEIDSDSDEGLSSSNDVNMTLKKKAEEN